MRPGVIIKKKNINKSIVKTQKILPTTVNSFFLYNLYAIVCDKAMNNYTLLLI